MASGFSNNSVEQMAEELGRLYDENGCSALLGLDFGGDVALPQKSEKGGPDILQRDLVNLLAIKKLATRPIPTLLVAAGLGCDAVAYAPDYEALSETATKRPVLELSKDTATGLVCLKQLSVRGLPASPLLRCPLQPLPELAWRSCHRMGGHLLSSPRQCASCLRSSLSEGSRS